MTPLPSGRVAAVLWDIDGTLLTSGRVAAVAFLDAVADVAGTRPSPAGIDFGGRIDPEIACLLLAALGLDGSLVPSVLSRLRELVAERTAELHEHTRPLPGVPALLERLATAQVHQTVVTGNVQSVGRLKLAAAGLVPPIDPETGGFGDSGVDRAAVARAALDALGGTGWNGALTDTWIVGDTSRDLDCARALGVRCALVATERRPFGSLLGLGADLVLRGLDEPDALLHAWRL